MHQGRYRSIPNKQAVQPRQQFLALTLQYATLAIGGGQCELKTQPPLAPKLDPIIMPTVGLWSGTDGVIPMPPEPSLGLTV